MYKIPDKYFHRLHQIRPRYKHDIENILLYVTTEISQIEDGDIEEFNSKLFNALKLYIGNNKRKEKTIHNWRTEISALFGLIEEDNLNERAKPGKIAKKLSESQDLVQFFKYFLFYFQYPGGHIKPHKLKQVIDKGIKFKPAKYFLKTLEAGEKITGKRFPINKAEATHFIYNDLRVTRDHCSPKNVVERIIKIRQSEIELEWKSDNIRYAGDILDYMVTADLLTQHGNNYYINYKDRETTTAFMDSDLWFSGYDKFYSATYKLSDLRDLEDDWFRYVNTDLGDDLFKTDVLKYLGIKEDSYKDLVDQAIEKIEEEFDPDNAKNTKEIGDFGENLILGHECMRIKNGGREDLIHLIKKIPTHFAVGYDIQSVELDTTKRYIEVKSTISNKALSFFHFHLTPNEWSTAETIKEAYYVYRLMISKFERRLYIIKDPVGHYKKDNIKMSPRNGADITFSEGVGEYKELLIWEK